MNYYEDLMYRLPIARGAHYNPEEGMCAMELVSWLAGEKEFSHYPKCTCPVISEFVGLINDSMDQKNRDRLWAYLPEFVGTVSQEHESERIQFLIRDMREYRIHDVLDKFESEWSAVRALRQFYEDVVPHDQFDVVHSMLYHQAINDESNDHPESVIDMVYKVYTAMRAVGDVPPREMTSNFDCGSVVPNLVGALIDYCHIMKEENYDPAFEVLEELLKIGPKGTGFELPITVSEEIWQQMTPGS